MNWEQDANYPRFWDVKIGEQSPRIQLEVWDSEDDDPVFGLWK